MYSVQGPVLLSRRFRLIWWAFVTVLTGAGLLISFAEVGMANWLTSKVGLVAVLVGCGLIFSALLWIASRLDD
jgi:uncharacterized membrane protein